MSAVAAPQQTMWTVTINGMVPTRAIFKAHGTPDFADAIPGDQPGDRAEFADEAAARELAAACTRNFPHDRVNVTRRPGS